MRLTPRAVTHEADAGFRDFFVVRVAFGGRVQGGGLWRVDSG